MCMGMPSKKSRVLDPASLPDTCTLLSGPNGRGRVYLVGTAHFSQESNEDVAAVIQAVKPDIVVLELCKVSGKRKCLLTKVFVQSRGKGQAGLSLSLSFFGGRSEQFTSNILLHMKIIW